VDFDKTGRFSREVLGIFMPCIDLSALTSIRAINVLLNEDGTISMSTFKAQYNQKMLGEITLDNWEPYVFDALRAQAANGVKNVIFDTLTSYDRVLEAHLTKSLTGFDLNRALRSRLVGLHTFCRTLGMRCVFVAHAKMPTGIEGQGGQTAKEHANLMHSRLAAQGAGNNSEVIFDMSTSAAALFRANTAARWPILNNGTISAPERLIFPYGNDAWEGGCKLQGLNPDGEEPNIKKILDKARAFSTRNQPKTLTAEVK
jgi:hypothetical protein